MDNNWLLDLGEEYPVFKTWYDVVEQGNHTILYKDVAFLQRAAKRCRGVNQRKKRVGAKHLSEVYRKMTVTTTATDYPYCKI
jgi:hypothetical protein